MQNAGARLLARAKGSLDGSTADLLEINQIRCCRFHQSLLPVRSAVRSLSDGEPTHPTSAVVALKLQKLSSVYYITRCITEGKM